MTDDDVMDETDQWDFYPCRVDDEPASIFLNLRYESEWQALALDTLYWVTIEMLDAADHRMGSSHEAEALFPVEQALCAAAEARGLVYVGRLRNHGRWQLTFYGASDQLDALNAIADACEVGDRTYETGCKPDDDWSYYREFLLPDAERFQWMQNRRLVDVLAGHGDVPSTVRRVDHWVYFPTAASRQAFIAEVARDGFAVEGGAADESDAEDRFGAQVFRDDPVELDHIHGVVMHVLALAERHGGDYDGWETQVQAPPAN